VSDDSKIEWTDATWNPVTGCTKVSPGCDHCYAETFAERWRGIPGHHFENGFDVTLRPERLMQPLHWKRPRRIFTNSMSDLFHESVPDDYIAQVFAVMGAARQHTFQVLTKRHARMRSLLSSPDFARTVVTWEGSTMRAQGQGGIIPAEQWPLPNVWLGVSVEDNKWADIRIHALLDTPAVTRFLSCEPLLGLVNLWHWINPSDPCVDCDVCGDERFADEIGAGHDRYVYDDKDQETEAWCSGPSAGTLPRRIDWIIAGGESGPGARPCELEWLRWIRDHCHHAEVPFFLKQLGSVLGRSLGAGSKGGDWGAWPEDLRVREFPAAAEVISA
jgi:protein gp37